MKWIVIIVLIFVIFCARCNENANQSVAIFDDSTKWNGTSNGIRKGTREKILSRKRRYLIFPQGSSFQVVFDEIIPIVDYNNFLIVGVTVALAWELPSDPPSEELEKIRDKLNDGTLFKRKDENANELKYTDKTKSTTNLLHPPDASQNFEYIINRKSDKKPYYYYHGGHNPTVGSVHHKYSVYNYPQMMKSPNYKSYSTQQNYRIKPGLAWANWRRIDSNRKSKPSIQYQQQRSKPKYFNSGQRYHHIYPVFGKRSIRSTDDYTLEDKFHLEYHRHTRHNLYSKISKYIQAQGKDGEQCLYRILCEFGKKSKDSAPGSFLGEVMRAIFSFPLNYPIFSHSRYKRYEEAHGYDGVSCKIKYPNCNLPFLENSFMS